MFNRVDLGNDRRGVKKEGKIIPVTCRERPYVSETSRLPHLLDNRLRDGGEVVSRTRRAAALYSRKIPGTHFC
jgi:hypothetical protein